MSHGLKNWFQVCLFCAASFPIAQVLAEDIGEKHLAAEQIALAFEQVCLEHLAVPSEAQWLESTPGNIPLDREEIYSDLTRFKKLFVADDGRTIIRLEEEIHEGGKVAICTLKTAFQDARLNELLTAKLTAVADGNQLGPPEKYTGKRFGNTSVIWRLDKGNWRINLYEGRQIRHGVVGIGIQTFPPESPVKAKFAAAVATNLGIPQ
ncbi:hypothetical protein [Brucella intermedia]|uniref:hypothetical protein n=1 Tax=Brucella intermedia TaxID=94625 RepID=UPI00124BCDA5|nr:hypothetical protein [Brucella intermedia]KAB2723338.1 hypothetical protein F9L02_22380 [Brucella intermedia]